MKRRSEALGIATALLMGACSGAASTGALSPDWGDEVDAVVAAMAAAYDDQDPSGTARFFSAGGTLDLSMWGQGVATTPEEVVTRVGQLWFQDRSLGSSVRADHVFVTPERLLVWWSAYEAEGFQNWAQLYYFGGRGRTASRAFTAIEAPFDDLDADRRHVLDSSAGYVDAWRRGEREDILALYTPDVVIRDDVAGVVWRGVEEVIEAEAGAAEIEDGPWPHVFAYRVGGDREAIILVYAGAECPMLQARHVVLDGDRISREMRYTHLPSARRCLTDLPDGWWSSFEFPPELVDNVTEVLDVGGQVVDLVNAEPSHEEFTRWMLDRFVTAGLGVPEARVVWYPPVPECTELGGLAIESADRYEGRHAVIICFSEDRLTDEGSQYGWLPVAAEYGLHEFAHIWMVDTLDDTTRAAFNERAGLTVWRGAEVPWRERGVEHAAFTIAWGLAGSIDARYPLLPVPACEELAARFEMLTGRLPLTHCGEGGWVP